MVVVSVDGAVLQDEVVLPEDEGVLMEECVDVVVQE